MKIVVLTTAQKKAHKKARDAARYLRNKEKIASQVAAWRSKNADKMRAYQYEWSLRRRYGITLAQYEELLREQCGKCAICRRKPKKKLLVDHDHHTGEVRGLLCFSCNTALGHVKDDTKVLLRMITYVRRAG